jgi:hypothetical protein
MWDKPLPIPAVAVSKPWAMSYELTCSQSSSLLFQNIVEKNKFNKENTTSGTGSGCEQALGNELWAHMRTIKLVDRSKYNWKILN